MESTWNVVHECDTKDNRPAYWTKRIDHPIYGQFVWIGQYSDSEFAVEAIPINDIKVLATCKSLSSAKRCVTANIG